MSYKYVMLVPILKEISCWLQTCCLIIKADVQVNIYIIHIALKQKWRKEHKDTGNVVFLQN